MNNEKNNMHKVTKLLEQSKAELESASIQIGQLKQELAIQQKYYEGLLEKAGTRAAEAENNQETFTVQDKYTLLNKLEEKSRLAVDLEGRLKAAVAEKESSEKMVLILQKELKLQEDHFQNTVGTQATYYAKLAEKSVNDEKQIKDLVSKLSADQVELNKFKTNNARNVQEA